MTDPITQAEVEEAQDVLSRCTPAPWSKSGSRVKWRESGRGGLNDAHQIQAMSDGTEDVIALVLYAPAIHATCYADAQIVPLARNLLPRLLAERKEREEECRATILVKHGMLIEARARAERAKAECARLREALERLVPAALILQQNAEACAVNHYGEDFGIDGLPGWLRDTASDIAQARQALTPTPESGRTE